MRRTTSRIALAALLMGGATAAFAADHRDGPAITMDPASDITDVYTWNSDATHLALVMDVFPAATGTSKFSDTVLYAIHTTSKTAYTATTGTARDFICQFISAGSAQTFTCFGNGEVVSGAVGNKAGFTSASGKIKIFAGLRDDPFFFNLKGFKKVAADVAAAAAGTPALTFVMGCPTLPPATAAALAGQLSKTWDGTAQGPALNDFAGNSVLSIVINVDKTVFTPAPIVGVWASTNRKN